MKIYFKDKLDIKRIYFYQNRIRFRLGRRHRQSNKIEDDKNRHVFSIFFQISYRNDDLI